MDLHPQLGGFRGSFGCGWFIREFLLGHGPNGSPHIDLDKGAPQTDIFDYYKRAIRMAYAVEDTDQVNEERVRAGLPAFTPEEYDETVDWFLRRIPVKLHRARYHSFVRYFHWLKQLKWVELTGEEEPSFQGGIETDTPWGKPGAVIIHTDELVPGRGTILTEVPKPRRFFRLTAKGRAATEDEWRDPLQALHNYPIWKRQGLPPPPDWVPV